MNSEAIKNLLDLASKAALKAGNYISGVDRKTIAVETKPGGESLASQVVTQVDVFCEHLIKENLEASPLCHNIAFLGEEGAANTPLELHPRFSNPYFWCVDPLDGTLPFTENIPGYAVSIALVAKNGEPILGVVYNPVSGILYQAIATKSARLLLKNNQPWEPIRSNGTAKPIDLTLFFDRSFTSTAAFPAVIDKMKEIAMKLGYAGIQIHHQAGSVINAVQVLENAPACYFKFPKDSPGGGSVWDFAATASIAIAADVWVSDIHGKALSLNSKESLFMNSKGVLFASDRLIASEVIKLYQTFSRGMA